VREEPSTPDLHEVALESVYNSGNVGNPSRETGVTLGGCPPPPLKEK
jgi:hypothetical protein